MSFVTPGYEDMELSTQIVIKEALNRNINVEVLDRKNNFIRLKKGSKVEYIKQASRTSADIYISPLIMENKLITKKILSEKGIRIPVGDIFYDIPAALASYEIFLKKDIVIKPNTTNFGIGINIIRNNQNQKYFEKAVKTAFKYDNSIVIENFLEGQEYRFLIIGDEVTAVLNRVPANVVGDGVHSIEELVIEKNKDFLRGEGHKTPLEKITLGDVEKNILKSTGRTIYYIPAKKEQIFLRSNSNISTGGDSIDFTDIINEKYKKIAFDSAKAVGAKICGVDMIIKDINADPNNKNHGIIEINFNPALHIHDFPYKGKNRESGKKILDLLGL